MENNIFGIRLNVCFNMPNFRNKILRIPERAYLFFSYPDPLSLRVIYWSVA